ncbi:hypothetical protein [Streptomyces sp. NBC_00212]
MARSLPETIGLDEAVEILAAPRRAIVYWDHRRSRPHELGAGSTRP